MTDDLTSRYRAGQPIDWTPIACPPILKSDRPIRPRLGQDRLVLCIAGGEQSNQLLALTAPRMRAYAERCGSQFEVVTDDLAPGFKVWNKYRVTQLARAFNHTLLLDTDVLVSSNAPDIFELCGDTTGVVNARRYMTSTLLAETKAYFEKINHPLPARLLNGGVILFNRPTLHMYRPFFLYRHWCHDQWWLSYLLDRPQFRATWLDERWNTLPTNPAYEMPHQCYMVHAAGAEYRLETLMQLDSLIP